jgi:predicted RNase H-like HicB family nuclease
MSLQALVFTGIVVRDGDNFSALCPELDIATQGHDLRSAKTMLREAVTGYLESCFESNVPYLRPVPHDEDPRYGPPQSIVKTFRLKVDLMVRVHV